MTEGSPRPYEILEHTADIGLRAWAHNRRDLFVHCARGLAEIIGRVTWPAEVPWPEEARTLADAASLNPEFEERLIQAFQDAPKREISLRASDQESLLVEWLNELLFTLETEDVCLWTAAVHDMTRKWLRGHFVLQPCIETPEGTEVKATTYHQLSVRRGDTGWEATVYFDV